VPLPGKTIPVDTWVLERGLLFLFVHWFNEGCCVERGEIGEEVRSVRKVTRETKGIPSSSVNQNFFCFLSVKLTNFPSIFEIFAKFSPNFKIFITKKT
jgi:hypothetical protein